MNKAKNNKIHISNNILISAIDSNIPITTTSRNSLITPILINKTLYIYNGHRNFKLFITKEMLGHKLGEFSPTKIKFIFKKKPSN